MSSRGNRFAVLGKASPSPQRQSNQIRITDLPAEVKDIIYSYLLATECVTKREENHHKFFDIISDNTTSHDLGTPVLRRNGDIQGQNLWIESSHYSLEILRVTRQIYQESSKVFSDNSWILVSVNRSFFTENLKSRGFNVIPVNSTQSTNVAAILTLSVLLPSRPYDSSGSDTFVMSAVDAGSLQRALSTVTGLEETSLTFVPGPDFAKKSNLITKAFSQLRGVGSASVDGLDPQHPLGILTRTITTPLISSPDDDDILMQFILDRLRNSLSNAQMHQTNQDWHKAAAECKTAILFTVDCHAIYSWRVLRDNMKRRSMSETFACLLAMLVEATFWIGDYEAVLHYSWQSKQKSPKDIKLWESVRDYRRRAFAEFEGRDLKSFPPLFRLDVGLHRQRRSFEGIRPGYIPAHWVVEEDSQ